MDSGSGLSGAIDVIEAIDLVKTIAYAILTSEVHEEPASITPT
jgi:hypothetical protein